MAVEDLRARQAGRAAELRFTLPDRAIDGSKLEGTWRVEIYRQFAATTPAPPAADLPGPPAYSFAAGTLSNYLAGDTVAFPDSLTPEEFEAHRGELVAYRVRTGIGRSSWSAQSNLATLNLTTPPQPVTDLAATVTDQGITLRWTPPGPGPAPGPSGYIVYRAAVKAGEVVPAAATATGTAADSSYRDTEVEPDATYRYTVRSVARGPGGEIESADSTPLVVRARQQAAPVPPTGVVAVAVRNAADSLEVDVSWVIGGEANLAGYNIYRSEQAEERGERLNPQLLAAASYRDMTVAPGKTYHYRVTAVNLAGEESEPGAAAAVTVAPARPLKRD